MQKLINIIKYGYWRLKSKDASNEFTNWLEFANAGMLNKGNIYLFDYAIRNLPDNSPLVEIGSFCGLSTNLTTYLLKKYSKPNKLISCDRWIFVGSEDKYLDDTDIKHQDYRQFIKDAYIRNIQFFSKGREPHTIEVFSDEFFDLWSKNAVVKDILHRETPLGGPISMAYIDGNHTFENTKRDFENTDKFLQPGGFILFDDTADYYEFGSARFMKEMKRNRNYELIDRNPNFLFRKKL